MKGKVIFIGAGPGDPDLITVKGRRVIEKADVIIYYDMAGRTVATIPVEAGATSITLNTTTLANGIYMFHMAGNVEKLVIRH